MGRKELKEILEDLDVLDIQARLEIKETQEILALEDSKDCLDPLVFQANLGYLGKEENQGL
jgi:hypothetical protein